MLRIHTNSFFIIEDVDLNYLEANGGTINFGRLPAGYFLKDVAISVVNASSTTATTATISLGTDKKADLFICDANVKTTTKVTKDVSEKLLDNTQLVLSLKSAKPIVDGKVTISAMLVAPTTYNADF